MNATAHIFKLLSSFGPRLKSIFTQPAKDHPAFNVSAKKREAGAYPPKHIIRARQSCGTHFELVGLTHG